MSTTEPLIADELQAPSAPPVSQGKLIWKRFLSNKLAVASAILFILIVLFSISRDRPRPDPRLVEVRLQRAERPGQAGRADLGAPVRPGPHRQGLLRPRRCAASRTRCWSWSCSA